MLTDTKIKNIKPTVKNKKYFDIDGLYLLVTPKGKKYWKIKYSFLSSPNIYSLGQYPHYSLQEAREELIKIRRLINEGTDPNNHKRGKKVKIKLATYNTFYHLAKEWFDDNKAKWTIKHRQKVWNRLEKYAFPVIGTQQINRLEALNVLDSVIRPLEQRRRFETAHKLLGNISAILRLGVATNRLKYNPVADLNKLLQPVQRKHRPAIDIDDLPELLKKLEAFNTYPEDKVAIKLLMLSFVRPCEIRKSKWEYLNIEKAIWTLPDHITKMRREHIVPLSKQKMKLFKELYQITGENEYMFPTKSFRKHPYMNENYLNNILKELGYKDKHCAHGFRALASTTLNDLKPELGDVIEFQLAHVESNEVRKAYNRFKSNKYMPQRIELMQFWADYIEMILNNHIIGLP